MKKCSKCKIDKPEENFYFSKPKNKLYAHCKECQSIIGKIMWKKHGPKVNLSAKAKRLNHPRWWLQKLSTRYGLTIEEYDSMFKSQNGVCAICGKPESMTVNGKVRRISIDHCHKTGKVRGLLCVECNSAIGKFDDDPNLIQKAIDYLKKYQITSLPATTCESSTQIASQQSIP